MFCLPVELLEALFVSWIPDLNVIQSEKTYLYPVRTKSLNDVVKIVTKQLR